MIDGFREPLERYTAEPDVEAVSTLFEGWSRKARDALAPFVETDGERRAGESEGLGDVLLRGRRARPFGLLRDLHDLRLLTNESLISLTVLAQASAALRDEEPSGTLGRVRRANERQWEWLMTRIKQAAPQILVVPS